MAMNNAVFFNLKSVNRDQQLELDFPWVMPSQATDEALQVLESSGGHQLHPKHQQRITALAHQIAHENLQRGKTMSSPEVCSEFIRTLLQDKAEECMAVLFLDCKHRVIAFEELFHGTIDQARVHIRVLVKRVLAHNAGALILAHNHPSGVTEPSQADIHLTEHITKAMWLIDVRLLDHFVVSTEGVTSLAERGLV